MDRADVEWRGVTGAQGLGQFSSAPTMDLRPCKHRRGPYRALS